MSFQISDLEAYASRFYGGAPILITPFAYTASFLANIANGGRAQVVVNIASNADFIATDLSYSLINRPSDVIDTETALMNLQIEDTGSNEKFFNSPVMLDNICNNAWGRQVFAFPRFVSGKTALQFNLENVSGTQFGLAHTYGPTDIVLTGALVRVFAQ